MKHLIKKLLQKLFKRVFRSELNSLEQKVNDLEKQDCQLQEQIAELKKQAAQHKEQLEQFDELEKDRLRVYEGNKGLMEEINFLKFRNKTLDELHESVVQGTWPHDGSFKDKKCIMPFKCIEILPRGEVYTCCSAFIKHNYFIGNIYTDTNFDSIWNSEKALKLRYSVSNGNFEYCQKVCKYFHTETSPDDFSFVAREQSDSVQSYKDCRIKHTPEFITLSCDESCNLWCASCRNKHRALDKAASDALYEKLMSVVRPMLKDCRHLGGLGSGDLFASSACSRFYKSLSAAEFPKLFLHIITNLQLLTPAKWSEFNNLHEFPIELKVSIDAACKATYEKIRRGAKWETLCENLIFFKEWRKKPENKIQKLIFHFLVQRDNISELEDFCRFAESMEADEVWFQQIANWGTYTEEEFKQINPFHADTPLRQENETALRSVLAKPWKLRIVQNVIDSERHSD